MSITPQIAVPGEHCRILSLDGGGAKGFYTLGVLAQVEAMFKGKPLCEKFDLIFGTSTGAIIAALLSLGYKVGDIHSLYKRHVPTVMKNVFSRQGDGVRPLASARFTGHSSQRNSRLPSRGSERAS